MEAMIDLEKEMPSDDVLYTALAAHDPRFDGRFFVAVSSTRIYCRAVCTAKLPKRENCSFFQTAAAAEAAGYRPCLKCRPELAPGLPVSYEMTSIAHRAAEIIRESPYAKPIAEIADGLGVSERQLRRIFEDEFGVSPVSYRGTCRLLLAKSLLTDTDLPITRVAYACGFSSVRRFNDAFTKQYRMTPTHLRKRAPLASTNGKPITIRIGYRPPYRYDLIIGFLAFRAIEGVEVVADGSYYRTVSLGRLRNAAASDDEEKVGWIQVSNWAEKNCLKLTVSPELFEELPVVIARVKRLFDTDSFPNAVSDGLADFHGRVAAASNIPGIRVPCSFDGFEMAVRAILGQQITVKAANTLAGRIAQEFGAPVEIPVEGLATVFPPPQAFCDEGAAERLGRLGVVRQRSKAICVLAQAICDGSIELSPGVDVREAAHKLVALPGIGEWTAEYLLMRAFDYPDAFPAADYGVKCAFPDMKVKDLKEMSKKWSPWRSYAVMSLWCTPHD